MRGGSGNPELPSFVVTWSASFRQPMAPLICLMEAATALRSQRFQSTETSPEAVSLMPLTLMTTTCGVADDQNVAKFLSGIAPLGIDITP